jgi:two-component system chemotaxis sensor kinase CheA
MNQDANINCNVPGLDDISKSYMEDFINEIIEIIEDIELELVNLEMDPGSKDILNSLYCHFHSIRGLADLINDKASTKISAATEDLLEALKKYSLIAGKDMINLLLDSVGYIKKLCSDSAVKEDSQFLSEVDLHVMNIKKNKDEIMLEARQPFGQKARIGEILVQEGYMDSSQVNYILKKQNSIKGKMKFGEIVLREKKADASEIIKAIRMQRIRNTGTSDQYVKIPLERLEQMICMIRSIRVIYGSIRDQAILRFGSNDTLAMESSKACQLIDDVCGILKELRMVTLQNVFQRLTRSACSIIEENHLEIMFSTMGENIEIDKDIADYLPFPLTELVRLLIEKVHTWDSGRKTRNIEVVAYEEGSLVHIDMTADILIDIEDLKTDSRYIDVYQKLSSMKCGLGIDDLNGEGIRFSLVFQQNNQ